MNFELCIDCRLFVRLSSYYFSRIALTLLSELVKDYQKVSLSTTPKVYLISRPKEMHSIGRIRSIVTTSYKYVPKIIKLQFCPITLTLEVPWIMQ